MSEYEFVETPPDRSLAGLGKGACGKVRCEEIHRYVWIKAQARGRVLDIGGNESSGWSILMPAEYPTIPWSVLKKGGIPTTIPMPPWISSVTVFDCDKWVGMFPLVRGDAHRLPFRDGSFDTVCLGDILEHVADDVQVLREAVRVARVRVVATTPDEYGWDPSLQPFKPIEEWVQERGSLEKLVEEETTGLRTDFATCMDYVQEPHHLHHVRWYDFEKITKLLESTGRPYTLGHVHYHENKFTNFVFTIGV